MVLVQHECLWNLVGREWGGWKIHTVYQEFPKLPAEGIAGRLESIHILIICLQVDEVALGVAMGGHPPGEVLGNVSEFCIVLAWLG